ncbi:unnamed protein product, partial [Ectocarpus sp. 6 AP-2014]
RRPGPLSVLFRHLALAHALLLRVQVVLHCESGVVFLVVHLQGGLSVRARLERCRSRWRFPRTPTFYDTHFPLYFFALNVELNLVDQEQQLAQEKSLCQSRQMHETSGRARKMDESIFISE